MLKNITLSAEEQLIEKAREAASRQGRTLNAAFREWLERFAGLKSSAARYDELMQRMSYVASGRGFTRDELNER